MTVAKQDLILILDFNSQYSQRVARKIRECGVYCEIADYDISAREVLVKNPRGIIFAGSFSGADKDNNTPDLKILETNIPTAGFIFDAPESAAASKLAELGVKFCREAVYTAEGDKILRDFLFETCACQGNWQMKTFAVKMTDTIRAQVGDKKVLCALSGGIDSAVVAILTHRAVGDKLTCVFVNHGFLRKGEAEQVIKTFRDEFSINLVYVDAAERFLDKIKGVKDPEQKRKIIGAEFIRVFETEAAKLSDIEFLAQGTIYPDIIESGTKAGAVVKSHHNVGGLPEDMKFKLVEPLRELFKDEVRLLAAELKLPEDIIWRQPFPGPGLAVRVIGEITRERLDILREADAIVQEEIKKAGLYRHIWQSFAILPDMKSVGVTRDKRTYAYTVGLRAVNSGDAMTAEWVRLPYDVLDIISSRIVSEVEEVNRVVYDITSKPPATIEWE